MSIKHRIVYVLFVLLLPYNIPPAQAFKPSQTQLLSVVQIHSQEALEDQTFEDTYWGSGYFVSTEGTIITNTHVILQDGTYDPFDRYVICLTTSTNRPDCRYTAQLLFADIDTDIALLSLSNTDIHGNTIRPITYPIQWGNSSQLEIGEDIHILGYPDVGEKTITQTRGIVSGFLYNKHSESPEIEWIKTDAKISEGNSGGVAFDSNGTVIGMPNLIMTGTENIGLLRPSSFIQRWYYNSSNFLSGQQTPVIKREIPESINYVETTSKDHAVSLEWDKPFCTKEIDHYEIIFDDKPIPVDQDSFDTTSYKNYISTTNTKITIDALENDREYFFYVRPVLQDGTTSIFWSKDVSETPREEKKDESYSIFKDVDNVHPSVLAISYLKQHGILEGYKDGTFKPNNTINRAELVKILIEGKKIDADPFIYKNCFKDVQEQWFASYVCYAKEQGWIHGYADKTFRPSQKINRAESLKIILEAYQIPLHTQTLQTSPFQDIASNDWYKQYAETASLFQLLEEKETFKADLFVTRAQIAENIYRVTLMELAGIIPLSSEEINQSITSFFPLNTIKTWQYKDIKDNTLSSQKMGENCSPIDTCYTIESDHNIASIFVEDSVIKGTHIQLLNESNQSFQYTYPESIFTLQNHLNYFRIKDPPTIQNGYLTFTMYDGVNIIEILGREVQETSFGPREVLQIKTTDIIRMNQGKSSYPNDLSNEQFYKIESFKEYAKDIGLISSISTTFIQEEEDWQEIEETNEILVSYE